VEKFFIDLKIARVPPPLTKDELRALARDLHVPALEPDAADRETLEKLLLADTSSPPPITEALKAEFEKLRAEDEKPIIAIVLMETLRATEVGFMNPNARSLTPNLDAAAHKGIYFSKAYSTGTVTRSGQEAVWCGYPSGQDSSMMRGRPDVRIPCLTKVAASENRPLSLWLHGGDGRFDGQRQFWIDQGTDITMALEDFPADAPRTGWGIGDIAWAETALQKLKEARTQTQAPWILAMFLSVTNHIPWQVPGDAPDEIKEFAKTATHRKYATTKYSDAALGRLITGLKSEGLWDKSILFVTGDHGNLEKPWVAPQGDEDAVTGNLLSHVPLVVTGGLPEKVRQKNPVMSKHIPWYVSIAGIAPTIAGITSIKGRWLGRDIFEKKQPTIWVDLGHALFVPATKEKIERSDVMQQRDFDEASQEKSSAVLHYRALNHLINEWGLSKKQ
jgi:phosphoglycerol transferase MdoB-like AlkP superfamily enzyme